MDIILFTSYRCVAIETMLNIYYYAIDMDHIQLGGGDNFYITDYPPAHACMCIHAHIV